MQRHNQIKHVEPYKEGLICKSRRRILIGVGTTLALSSCGLGPKYDLSAQQEAAIESREFSADYSRIVSDEPTISIHSIERMERLFYSHEQALEDFEEQLYAHHNRVREEIGLEPLIRHDELDMLADIYSRSMSMGGYFRHHPAIDQGVTARWSSLGENLGTTAFTPEGQECVLQAFLDSPEHYRNIVNPDFTYIGIGAVPDMSNHDRGLLVTVRFMTIAGSP